MTDSEPKPIFRSYGEDKDPHAKYSHVIEPIVPGHVVELSGIIGEEAKKLVEGGAGPESECILAEIKRLLEIAHLSLRNVMKVEVKLAGPVSDDSGEKSEDFEAMNAVYNEAFGNNSPPPARCTVGGLQLLHHARVEMVVTAFRPDAYSIESA